MKLKSFRIADFHCILDSDWVEINDIGILVGKNESGKTSMLKALHKFKPFQLESYAIEREWPRICQKRERSKFCSCINKI